MDSRSRILTFRLSAARAFLAGVLALAAGACASPAVHDLGAATPALDAADDAPTASPTPDGSSSVPACSGARHAVVVWGLRDWETLDKAFADRADGCADYYISIPPVACDAAGKICPRGPLAPEQVRAHGANFHAMAEFHWASWSSWVSMHGATWRDAGLEFRKRMQDAGYDVAKGDTWAINELPTSVRTNRLSARTHARNVVAALEGSDTGLLSAPGVVFNWNMGHDTTNLSVYKASMRAWLKDASFWSVFDAKVKYFAQETYVDPALVCVPGATVAARSLHVNEFAEHPAELATSGGAATAKAHAYFAHAYVPLFNGSADNDVFQTSSLNDATMQSFVSLQVYAARAWSGTHGYPGRRTGFAWAPAPGAATLPVAARMAAALAGAYAPGGTAARACTSTGNLAGCACSVPNAHFSESWAGL